MKKRFLRNEKGQSLIIVAFAIFALIGFVGLAIDLGLAFVERIRVRRAADAAALAAAAELPLENAAIIRALEYLEENEYGCGLQVTADGTNYYCDDLADTRVEINVGAPDEIILGPEDALRIIGINTSDFRDMERPNPMNTSSRIRVEVTERVGVFFMRIFNFLDVPVQGVAVGENINQLDIALVFDNSGSMEFDTICYGCWAKDDDLLYPQGTTYPLPWDSNRDGTPDHCAGNAPLTYSSRQYFVIEAEEYTFTNNAYERRLYNIGDTYWAVQRNGGQSNTSYMGDAGAYGRDSIGSYIQHRPARTHVSSDGTGVPCTWDDLLDGFMCRRSDEINAWGGPRPAPQVSYEFTVPTTGSWYIWVRAQGGDNNVDSNGQNRTLHWGINGTPKGRLYMNRNSDYTNGAKSDGWTWHRLREGSGNSGSQGGTGATSQTLTQNETYTLNLWAGGPGTAVDRIIITNDDRNPANFFTYSSGDSIRGRETGIASGYYGIVNNVLRGGQVDNNRTGYACDPCDARFGGSPSPIDNRRPICTGQVNPQERYLDNLYDDEQPMRASVEAAKNFVRRLDPRYDQIGYVSYNSNATIRNRLECLRRRGVDTCIAGYDPDLGKSSNIIESTVIANLDSTNASGGTNIAHGIMLGIDVLSNRVIGGQQNYGRPGAAHIMIVMTDGETNTLSGVDSICYAQQLWPIRTGDLNRDRAKDCAIFYARQARDNGIVIYSITLGATADTELMAAVAETTGGVHRHAPRPEQLDTIFDELYERIFLRLVQ